MRFIIFLAVILTLNSSYAHYAQVPFDPAYASDQPEITFDSLGGEISQFQQWSNWYQIKGNIERQKIEVETLRKAYERGKALIGGEAISREELERREYKYLLSKGQLGEMESRAQMQRISLESTKIGIMMNGDRNLDLRKELAEKMKESLEFQLKALNYSQDNARLTEIHEGKQAAIARDLFNKKAISQVEYESRIQAHEISKIQKETLTNQIDVIGKAIAGLEKSLGLLF